MTRISVELVPRSPESLLEQASSLAEHAPWADTINVPDLVRFDLRSWEACGLIDDRGPRRPGGVRPALIPHIRAVDCDPDAPLPMASPLSSIGVREVVVISGDDGEWFRPSYPVDAVDVIRRIRAEYPEVTVWAGLDPYRQGMADELRYLRRKVCAGAAGVFTQPFFDMDLMRAWKAILPDDLPVWWGATTVTTPAAMGYWRQRNKAVFPTDFTFDLGHQQQLAQHVLDLASEWDDNAYLMPVRMRPADYLGGLKAPAPGQR